MSILNLIIFPNDLLHKACEKVDIVNDEIKQLANDMIETMRHYNGAGLAAPQVGELKQIFVMDIPNSTNGPMVFINPVISNESKEKISFEEGCLSFPNLFVEIERHKLITISAMNINGEEFTVDLLGLPAICAQHEVDHLAGKLFTENLSLLKRTRAMKKFGKLQKEQSNASKH